jgi:hypothetical protein
MTDEELIEAVAKAIYVAYVKNPNAGWDARNPTKKSNIWFLQAPAAIAAAEPIIKDGLRDRIKALTTENEELREHLSGALETLRDAEVCDAGCSLCNEAFAALEKQP